MVPPAARRGRATAAPGTVASMALSAPAVALVVGVVVLGALVPVAALRAE